MMTLHHMPSSGNSYKVRLLLAHLNIPVKCIATEYGDGYTSSDEFLAINPMGKVPLLELEDGRTIGESDAILFYLAEGTPLLPNDRYERAKCLQWMFFEQYYHEPSIAVRMAIFNYEDRAHLREDKTLMNNLLRSGSKALHIMEEQLDEAKFITGNTFTVADICLYGYTHAAHKGGYKMERWPNIDRWLKEIAAMNAHQPIEWAPPSA